MIYRATKKQTVKVVGGKVTVKRGDLVAFDKDPGSGWEEVKKKNDSDSWKGS